MADIFISYSRADRERVKSIVDVLEAQSWTVWWDTRLRAGEQWDAVIEREIKAARCVVVVWSPVSVKRRWVNTEATFALGRGTLVPVIVDRAEPPLAFSLIQAADCSDWTGDAAAPVAFKLIEDVREKLAATPAASREAEPPQSMANLDDPLGTVQLSQAAHDWALIEASSNPRDFRDFTEEYPQGILARRARHRLADLAEAAWGAVRQSQDATEIARFLRLHYDSEHIEAAKAMLTSLEAEAERQRIEAERQAEADRSRIEAAARAETERRVEAARVAHERAEAERQRLEAERAEFERAQAEAEQVAVSRELKRLKKHIEAKDFAKARAVAETIYAMPLADEETRSITRRLLEEGELFDALERIKTLLDSGKSADALAVISSLPQLADAELEKIRTNWLAGINKRLEEEHFADVLGKVKALVEGQQFEEALGLMKTIPKQSDPDPEKIRMEWLDGIAARDAEVRLDALIDRIKPLVARGQYAEARGQIKASATDVADGKKVHLDLIKLVDEAEQGAKLDSTMQRISQENLLSKGRFDEARELLGISSPSIEGRADRASGTKPNAPKLYDHLPEHLRKLAKQIDEAEAGYHRRRWW